MSASALRALHVPGNPLVLPNAWDAASAALVADAGFPAVATSSSALARSLGYADGEQAPATEMFAAAARIVRAVSVPVTVDAEAGYGLAAGELVAALASTGAVGCNIEDTDHTTKTLRRADEQARRIAAIRAAAGGELVINARIDSFLGAADEQAALADAIERAQAYLAAGADCVFPIRLRSATLAATFVRAVRPAAVNFTALSDGIDIATAGQLGAARVSLGGGLFAAQQQWLSARLAEIAAG
ncbi:MAG: isocitrate lyase/PEP mutase family protein [Sciscionella sp.]